MRCPFCGSLDTQVKDSRPTDDASAIRRRRVCPDCAGRFTTFERVQLRELTILKRSGRRTPFDRDKLAHYADHYRKVGGYTYDRDPQRPGWYSIQPETRFADPARR